MNNAKNLSKVGVTLCQDVDPAVRPEMDKLFIERRKLINAGTVDKVSLRTSTIFPWISLRVMYKDKKTATIVPERLLDAVMDKYIELNTVKDQVSATGSG